MFQDYFVDATLINHQLIVLSKFYISPSPKELESGNDISIKLIDGSKEYCFDSCHIDNTRNRRLRIPGEVMVWLKNTYAFSVAYFSVHTPKGAGDWTKKDREVFYNAVNKKTAKMDVPRETIRLDWDGKSLLIKKGFILTPENAPEYLTEKAVISVLPYIFSSVKNTSIADVRDNGKKCYVIDRTTDWLPVKDYSETAFSHPGLYLLRRRTNNGYAYYVGKANDIKNRIVRNDNKVSHPDEKGEDDKQYDDIACVSIRFDDIMKLYGVPDERIDNPPNNPGVKRGSDTDNALYAVEDVAIHVVAMILKSEGKMLDNKQYRSYTSEWLRSE